VRTFTEIQAALDERHAEFIETLDRSRIVTLHEILTAPEALDILQAQWIDTALLRTRIEAGFSFFEAAQYHGAYARLFFFERSDLEEVRASDAKMREENDDFRIIHEDTPPESWHLHIGNDFLSKMQGVPARLCPLQGYADVGHGPRRAGALVGYHLPQLPKLLGIGAATATEYLARILVHDIGHGLVPPVASWEFLHNIAAKYAARAPQCTFPDPWEQLVYDECTDPYFSLRAEKLIAAAQPACTQLRAYYARVLRRWYACTKHKERLYGHFDIHSGDETAHSERIMEAQILELQENGFTVYLTSRQT
jgi:hypothetical protein